MSLQSLIKEIKLQREYAKLDPYVGDPALIRDRAGRKRNAVGVLEALYPQYKREMLNRLGFIVIAGSQAKEALEVAPGVVKYSADSFFSELVAGVDKNLLTGRESPATLIDMLSHSLDGMARQMDILSYNQMIYNAKYSGVVASQEQLTDLAKRLIFDQVGSEIVGYHALEVATREAFEQEYDGSVLPVMVSVEDAGMLEQVLSGLKKLSPTRTEVAVAGEIPANISVDIKLKVVDPTEDKMQKQVISKIQSKFKK
jgi:hypothetical protein